MMPIAATHVRRFTLAMLVVASPLAAQEARKPNAVAPTSHFATATLSGGCYWTMETVFEHTRGVVDVVSGITGREAILSQYHRDPTHTSGGAESVRITYDPSQLSYEELLRVYFTAAHDPSQVDRQGPDAGARYRSVVWVSDNTQRAAAMAAIAALEQGKVKVATQVAPVADFRPVVESEQDFAEKNPTHPYITYWDVPRLERYRKLLPELYRDREKRLVQ